MLHQDKDIKKTIAGAGVGVLLLLALLLPGTVTGKAPVKVLFFGDSITFNGTSWEGAWISLLQSYAKEAGMTDIEWVPSGVPGDRVTDLYLRMEKDVLDHSPDIVVLYVGVNDIWHKVLSGTGTDYVKFGQFYDALAIKLENKGIRVIVCTPSCIGERTGYTNECDGDLNRYSAWIRGYAQDHDIPLVDLRSAFLAYHLKHNKENKYKGVLTADGVHLTQAGSILVANEAWPVLQSTLDILK